MAIERMEGDPSTWRGAEMAQRDDWILRLSAVQRAEVQAALRNVAELRPAEFGRDDFPLPTLAPVLRQVLSEIDTGRGFVLLRDLPVDPDDVESAARLLWGIGCHLGRALRQHARVNLGGVRDDLIAHIVDQGLDYDAPNVHGSATSAEQMPHTDPGDVVALLCVRPSDSGGISRIVSSTTVYRELMAQDPKAVEVLCRGYYHDLRNQQANADGSVLTPHRVPVYAEVDGVLSCSFNSKTVLAAERKSGQPLSSEERAALELMLRTAMREDLVLPMRLQTGDLQLLNNYTILHGRSGWTDTDPARRRLMLRLWLKIASDRPVPPELTAGYVAGTYYDVARQIEALAGRQALR